MIVTRRLISGWLVGLSLGMSAGVAAAENPKPTPAAVAAPVAASQASAAPSPTAGSLQIQDHMDVKIEYSLTVDGAVVDSSEGKEPLQYRHGQHQLVPGLERELVGLHVGDAKEVVVQPSDAYGQINPASIVEVPKQQLPSGVTPQVGMVLRGVNPDGQAFRAKVQAVKKESVVLDLNHPLAGKTLNFKVKVIDIQPAKE